VRRSTIYLFVLGIALVVASAPGFVGWAQNSNSSTTMATGNENKPKPSRRGRRGTRKPAATTADMTTEASASEPAMPAKPRYGRCDPSQQEQTDLSGTYAGKVKHNDEAPMDATLTITGNNFTMTTGSDTHSGRITAVTTCGYTAVTVMMGDLTPPAPGPNPPAAHPAMSLRAKKVGDSLTLTSVPGEPQKVWFSTGGAMKPKPRRHRTKKAEAPPTPAKTTP